MEETKEFRNFEEDVTVLADNLDLERPCYSDKNSFSEDHEGLEFEDIYSIVCSTNTPSFDEAEEIEETEDTPLWLVGQQVYNEFQWSDSEQSEIDFELPPKNDIKDRKPSPKPEYSNNSEIKYLKIKSGNIVKKIKLNLSDISACLNKIKREENYNNLLKLIKQKVDKKGSAGDQPPIVSPEESELQGMTEEEKIKQTQIWQQELAKIEEEIQTLKHVLQSKQRDSQELKKKLGISVWKELSDDFTQGVRNVKESNVYQNVEEKFTQWGKAVADAPIYQKTESVMKATAENTRSIIGNLTGGFTQKIGQLKNSESFRSLEEKMGSAYENVKTKVSSSRSSSLQSFKEALCEDSVNRIPNVTSPTSPTIPEAFDYYFCNENEAIQEPAKQKKFRQCTKMDITKDDIIANLRAIIISSKGGLKVSDVRGDYKESFGVDVPLEALGYKSLEEFFKNNSLNFTVIGNRVQAVTKASSFHIASLVNKQKSTRKKVRSKLISKEALHLRKPIRNINDQLSDINSKKNNQNARNRSSKHNEAKENVSSTIKQSKKQEITYKKNVENVLENPFKIPENDASQSQVKPFKNLIEIKKTIKNNFVSSDKKAVPDMSHENTKENRLHKKKLIPFHDIQDLNVAANFQSQMSYLCNNMDQMNLINNNDSNICENQMHSSATSQLNSPFRRSLLNNSEQDILSAKKTAKDHIIKKQKGIKKEEIRLPEIPKDVEDNYNYEQKLKQFCRDKGLIMPTYSIIIRESNTGSKGYGCKLNIGGEFEVSTYPVETQSELTARELASKKAYTQLSLNNNLPKIFYKTEYVNKLIQLCEEKNLPEPVFKSIECHPKNEPQYFICKVRVGEDILLSSYPAEIQDEVSARELAAHKAYEHLTTSNITPLGYSKDENATLNQIYEIIKTKEYGVWRNKLQNLYLETYNEELQPNWFDLVKKSHRFEITKIEKVGYIIRGKTTAEGEADTTELATLATLRVPESNQWEVYITNVVTSTEIWCRLIGKDYSEVYDSMMTKLELHPPSHNVNNPIEGEIYVVNIEESWNRVKVIEIVSEKNSEVSVFLLDIGVHEVVKISQLFHLEKKFFSVPPQAILLSLNELDNLSECEELQVALFHSLLGNTFIAEIVAILDSGGASSVNLWDTSTEEDININLKLLDDVIKTLKSPSLPPVGIIKEMFVSCIDDNGDLYLQSSKQIVDFLESIISTKMKYSTSLVSVNNKKLDPKKLYITRSTKTGLFCRAKVVKSEENCIVKLIDYGYEQQTSLNDLMDLELTSFELATIPSQVVRAKFASSKALSTKAVCQIRDQILEQSVLVKVKQTTIGCLPLVELLIRSQTDGTLCSINNKIANDDKIRIADIPLRKKSYVIGLENTLLRNLPMPNIPPVGSYFNVFVTLAAHPGLFSVQPLTTQNELMELMFRLQEKCEKLFLKPLTPEEFKIGDLYAVKHSDNFWYRAYAQAFTGSSNFIVCLCDFGDFIETSGANLMPLSSEFKTFPYQAIRAYLAGIEPVDKDWPALDCVRFRELVVEKQFVSQIIEINRDVKNPNYISLGLLLVDTSSSDDIYIHKVLIEKKMAVLKS